MKIMENKLFFAGLLFMGFGALLGRWSTTFAFGFILFLTDTLERGGMLRPLLSWLKKSAKTFGSWMASCLLGERGPFAAWFSRSLLYLFAGVLFISVARAFPGNGWAQILGGLGYLMFWGPPVALIIALVGAMSWNKIKKTIEEGSSK